MNSKQIIHVRTKILKLLKKTKELIFVYFGLSNGFLDIAPKVQGEKEEVVKWDLISHQNLKLSCFKLYHQENEKITCKMGDNFCKSFIS